MKKSFKSEGEKVELNVFLCHGECNQRIFLHFFEDYCFLMRHRVFGILNNWPEFLFIFFASGEWNLCQNMAVNFFESE